MVRIMVVVDVVSGRGEEETWDVRQESFLALVGAAT
jgi:hypothetical protein